MTAAPSPAAASFRTAAGPARPSTLAVVVTAGVSRYLPRTLRGLTAQDHLPEVVVIVDVAGPDRDVGTGVPVHDAVIEAGLADAALVRVVRAPQAQNFGAAVRDGLAEYHRLVERAAERARRREERGGEHTSDAPLTGEVSPVTTGEIRVVAPASGPAGAGSEPEWLWLLHDDSAPAPSALDHLLRAVESGRSIALAGPKQCGWADPDQLLEVGITATRTARRLPEIEPGEIDQGQHDHREDVLAVGTAGALVRRTVWDELGGTDPALGPFGDGLELSRRARLAGHRVVVVPAAVVHHAQASLLGQRPATPEEAAAELPEPDLRRSFLPRRRAQIYNAVLAAPALAAPLMGLGYLVLGAARALWRVATKEIGMAGAEFAAPLAVLGQALPLIRARSRTTRRFRPAALTPLEARGAQLRRARRDLRRTQATAQQRRVAPSELEIAERAAVARRRRLGAGVTTLLLLGLTLAAFGPLLTAGPLTSQPAGSGAGGLAAGQGALLPADLSGAELWELARSGWLAAGIGAPGPADAFWQILAIPALLGVSGNSVITALIVFALPLAGLGAWFAAGAASRAVSLRALAALSWALAPALLLAAGHGRLGPLLAHLALPWAVLGAARALGVERRDRTHTGVGTVATLGASRAGRVAAGAGSALALAVACAGAPVLLPAALLAAVLMWPLLPVRRRGWVLAAITVPALVVLAPLLQAAAGDLPGGSWRMLLAGGAPAPVPAAGPWEVLLGWPAAPVAVPVNGSGIIGWLGEHALLLSGAALGAGAVLALLRGTSRARAVRAGWLLALTGMAVALIAQRTEAGLAPAGDGALEVVPAWAGAGTSLLLLGVLMAVLSGGDGLHRELATRSFGWAQVVAGVLGLLLFAGPLLTGAGWLWAVHAGTDGQPGATERTVAIAVAGREGEQVPAIAQQYQESGTRGRVLALRPDGEGVQAEVWRYPGRQGIEESAVRSLTELRAHTEGEAGLHGAGASAAQLSAELQEVIASLAAGGEVDAATVLGHHAIGVVVLPPGVPADADARAALANRLDAEGLEYVTENPTGAFWRVPVAAGAGSVARARILDADGTVAGDLPAGHVGVEAEVPAGSSGRLMVLAEPADAQWRAWYDDEPLRSLARDGQQAFALPAEAGTLRLDYHAPLSSVWSVTQVVVFALTGLLALPLRRRPGRAVIEETEVPEPGETEPGGTEPGDGEPTEAETAEQSETAGEGA